MGSRINVIHDLFRFLFISFGLWGFKNGGFLGGGAKHNEIAQSACNALKDTVQNN